MTDQDEVVLAWHRLLFRLACAEKSGKEFQSFFEEIMEKADGSFIKVKPAGRAGDWKCDGMSQESGTVFQVYAPESLTAAEAAAKVREDFDGAKDHWGQEMRVWVFVWSAQHRGLPPQVVKELQDMRTDNSEVEIDDWGRDALWEIVAGLGTEERNELLGRPPVLALVTQTTAAEVQTLVNFLSEQEIPPLDEDLERIDLEAKFDHNELDNGVRTLVRAAYPLVPTVESYVSGVPDPRFSQRVAIALQASYDELLAAVEDPNAVFAGLVQRLAAGNEASSREYWAAVAVIAHYFELCDIFEH